MSKAMDALEEIKTGPWLVHTLDECNAMFNAIAILRDYITTTEAERDGLEPGELVAKGDCPICGGSLDIVIGEDESELSVVGKPLCGGDGT